MIGLAPLEMHNAEIEDFSTATHGHHEVARDEAD
jgi:hypothetical protein